MRGVKAGRGAVICTERALVLLVSRACRFQEHIIFIMALSRGKWGCQRNHLLDNLVARGVSSGIHSVLSSDR